MREKQIEQRLVKAVKAQGGLCPKLVSPGTDGMPDRMVLLPDSHMGFVEVKAPGEKPGYKVSVLDDPEQIPPILDEIRR